MQAEVEASIEEFGVALTEVEALLEPLLNESYRELLARLPPMDAAKLNVMIAYTINSLYYMLLKTQGVPTKKHQVLKELDRVRSYVGKLKELSNKAKAKDAQIKLNVDAANRFIKHALSDTDQQPSVDTDQVTIASITEDTPSSSNASDSTTTISQPIRQRSSPTSSSSSPSSSNTSTTPNAKRRKKG